MSAKLIDYAALAKMTGISQATLRTLVHRREVPHIRLSTRIVRFRPDEIEAWLVSRSVPAGGHAR